MKALGDALSFVVFVALILALFFLFTGSPDVWDRLHERAMNNGECSNQVVKEEK